MKPIAILAISCCLIFATPPKGDSGAVQSGPNARITPEAIWKPSPGKLAGIKEVCGKEDELKRFACFFDAMRAAGASTEALAFTLSLGEDPAYLYHLQPAGPVDLAYITYPFREKYSNQLLALNGDPPRFDLDSSNLLKDIAQDAAAKDLFPSAASGTVMPGSHAFNFPLSRALAGGGVELVVDYGVLPISAHTILFARLLFDRNGKFVAAVAQDVGSTYFNEGSQANNSLHFRLGDFFQLPFSVFADNSPLVTLGDESVVRELDHVRMATWCASPCVAGYIWTFEAVGKGETSLVFRTSSENTTKGRITQSSEYRIHVN